MIFYRRNNTFIIAFFFSEINYRNDDLSLCYAFEKKNAIFLREFDKKLHVKHDHIIQNHQFWIILSKLLIHYFRHSNAMAFNIFEIFAKKYLFFNAFVSKQISPNCNSSQNHRLFSDSSFTFFAIIF